MNLWILFIHLSATLLLLGAACLRSYLLHFRFRELRQDLDQERNRLNMLFRCIRPRGSMERLLWEGPLLWTCIWAASAVLLMESLVKGIHAQQGPWMAALITALLILAGLALAVTLRITLPKKIGPALPAPILNGMAMLLAFADRLLLPLHLLLRWIRAALGIPSELSTMQPDLLDLDLHLLGITEEGLRLTPVSEKITRRSLLLNNLCVYDILLPRNQVQYFDLADGIEANLEIARKTGHTRFPLCYGDLDNCKGIIHIKDLFRSRAPLQALKLEKMVRPILRFPQDQPLDRVLQELMHKRVHMALVEDEFGGVIGLVTLERILEELVGEIHDEFDREEKLIVPLRKDFYRVSGMTPLHEMEVQLGVEGLEHEDLSSFGGLISYHLGRIPAKGETVEIGPMQITILEQDDTRVILANVKVLSLPRSEIPKEDDSTD
jgi:CBS domain containing-hemolysin-like protein